MFLLPYSTFLISCSVFFRENGKQPSLPHPASIFYSAHPPPRPSTQLSSRGAPPARLPARLRGLGYIAVIAEQRNRDYKICIECKKRPGKGISPRLSVTADYTLWVICLVMMGDEGWAGMLASISIWFYSRGILAGPFDPAAVTTGDAGGGMH